MLYLKIIVNTRATNVNDSYKRTLKNMNYFQILLVGERIALPLFISAQSSVLGGRGDSRIARLYIRGNLAIIFNLCARCGKIVLFFITVCVLFEKFRKPCGRPAFDITDIFYFP